MRVAYTKHALDKLRRTDIKNFGINKRLIKATFMKEEYVSKTKYGAYAILMPLNGHTLRVVYAILGSVRKVITFHVAKKGRYEGKVL